MFQILHLNILKVDRVLPIGCAWKRLAARATSGGGVGPLLWRSLTSPTRWGARLSLSGYLLTLAPRIGRLGTCKYNFKSIDIFYIYSLRTLADFYITKKTQNHSKPRQAGI